MWNFKTAGLSLLSRQIEMLDCMIQLLTISYFWFLNFFRYLGILTGKLLKYFEFFLPVLVVLGNEFMELSSRAHFIGVFYIVFYKPFIGGYPSCVFSERWI